MGRQRRQNNEASRTSYGQVIMNRVRTARARRLVSRARLSSPEGNDERRRRRRRARVRRGDTEALRRVQRA